MKISEGKIVESTVYPGMKSIRSLDTTPSECWMDVSDAEARKIREIFEPFDIGETVIVFSKKELQKVFKKLSIGGR